MNKNEIIQHLNSAHQLFREEAKNLSPSLLNLSTHGKWSIAQHIDHINKSIAPLCNYLRLPKDKIALKWGLSNRTSLSFKDLQEKFQHAVSSGLAKASGSYLPAERSDFSAEDLILTGKTFMQEMIGALDTWDETVMDKYICPHPVLGSLTLKEMLYFTICHAEHHHQSMRRLLTSYTNLTEK